MAAERDQEYVGVQDSDRDRDHDFDRAHIRDWDWDHTPTRNHTPDRDTEYGCVPRPDFDRETTIGASTKVAIFI